MTDRYADGLRALRTARAPDRWAEIARRTGAGGGTRAAIHPDQFARGPRRAWPSVLAAAAVLTLVLAVAALVVRQGTELTITDAPRPGDAPGPVDPTTAAPGTTTATLPAAECAEIILSSRTPPVGWSGTLLPALGDDPRLPPALSDTVVGVFAGDTTTRAAFVAAGRPQPIDAPDATGPLPGGRWRLAPVDDGWQAEVEVPWRGPAACVFTLYAIGIDEDDFRQLVGGLEASA